MKNEMGTTRYFARTKASAYSKYLRVEGPRIIVVVGHNGTERRYPYGLEYVMGKYQEIDADTIAEIEGRKKSPSLFGN